MKVAASVANSANYDACQLRSACQLPLDEPEYNAPMNYDNCEEEREGERGGSLHLCTTLRIINFTHCAYAALPHVICHSAACAKI